jgi:hypothetical protein
MKGNFMKTYHIIPAFILLITTLCTFVACSPKDDLHSLNTSQLIDRGWDAFSKNKFSTAEKHFDVLTTRADGYLQGHYGLGWTYLMTRRYQNAKNEYEKFMTTDTLGVYSPSDPDFIDVRAGQVFVFSALSEHQNTINTSNTFGNASLWSFRRNPRINVIDIRLARATSQYATANFSGALTTIRLIDTTFEADINTVEGRKLLADKIEALLNSRQI